MALSELVDKPFLRLMDCVVLALDDSTKRNNGALITVGVEFVAVGFEGVVLLVFGVVFGDKLVAEVVVGFDVAGFAGFSGDVAGG